MAKNHNNDKTASKRENNNKQLNKPSSKKTSEEASIFGDENNVDLNDNSLSQEVDKPSTDQASEAEILEEIENAMKEGVYRKTEEIKLDTKEEQEATASTSLPQQDKPATDAGKKIKKGKKVKKAKKNYEKTTFSHKMRVLATLMVLGIFTGSGLGVWYFNVNLKSNVDYGSPSAADYIKPVSTVLSTNFPAITSASQHKDWLDYVGDKTPNDVSAVDNVLLAVHNASLADSFLFTGNGKAISLGITQTVYSQRRHFDNIYTFESISKGTISVANFDYMEGNNDIEIYTGQNIEQRKADWHFNRQISQNDYEALTGSLPSGITPYIISEKTILSSDMKKDEETGHYVITFNLDPVTSILNYYKEVRRTGGLEADPEFYSVKYTATIDSRWNLITTEVSESYKAVKFGMGVTCNGTILIDYQFNVDVTLPPLIKG